MPRMRRTEQGQSVPSTGTENRDDALRSPDSSPTPGRQETVGELDRQEAVEECGAKGAYLHAKCELPKGHCKTMDDWHECTAELLDVAKTNTYHTTRTAREVTRWRPNPFDIENVEERKKEIDRLVGVRS
jgi:hypothetical protein